MKEHAILEALVKAVPSGTLLPVSDLPRYTLGRITPRSAVRPQTAEQVATLLATASEHGWGGVPFGGGTSQGLGGAPTRYDVALDMTAFDRVVEHTPDDLVCTVQAGVRLDTLRTLLREHGQHLPLEAPLPRRATIGGVLASSASGPRHLGYGLARDWLIGITVAYTDGTVAKAGGKVVKNVSGFDLCRAHVGALGTLGVIVEASFKLAPLPPTQRTLVATFPTTEQAIAAAQRACGGAFLPLAAEVLDARVAAEVGGLPPAPDDGAALCVLVAGRTSGVERKAELVAGAAKAEGARAVEALDDGRSDDPSPVWQAITDLGAESDAALALRVDCPPSATARAVAALRALAAGARGAIMVTASPGSGAVRAWLHGGDSKAFPSLLDATRHALASDGALLVVERADPDLADGLDLWGPLPGAEPLARRLKAQFDPAGVLNPGRAPGLGRLTSEHIGRTNG